MTAALNSASTRDVPTAPLCGCSYPFVGSEGLDDVPEARPAVISATGRLLNAYAR